MNAPTEIHTEPGVESAVETTVAFTGHRTYCGGSADALLDAVQTLCARGMRTFLTGMAVGFDLAAAETVIACRALRPELRLVAVVPFEGQDARFPAAEKARFRRILDAADETVVLSASYHRGCYAVRNDYLVDRASVVVAWYDSLPGGTQYTVRRALACGREVWNLHPSARVVVRPAQGTLF